MNTTRKYIEQIIREIEGDNIKLSHQDFPGDIENNNKNEYSCDSNTINIESIMALNNEYKKLQDAVKQIRDFVKYKSDSDLMLVEEIWNKIELQQKEIDDIKKLNESCGRA